jgi:HPt (histidine-containing phosphotransfer) domain-containing protein
MDGYISKPVDQRELLETVARYGGRAASAEGGGKEPLMSSSTNISVLKENFAAKPALLRRLVQAFRETSAQDLANIEAAVREHDAQTLERAAHRLAGGAGFVCADTVRRLAADLERRAVDRQLDGLESTAAELRRQVARSIAELNVLFDAPADRANAEQAQQKETIS